MFSRRGILLYLSLFVIHHVPISIAEFQYSYCIPKSGKFTSNSTYQKNLNTLFSTLSSNPTDENGYFYTNFVGDSSSERVGAMVLCRGDVPDLQTCRSCIDDTVTLLNQECGGNKEGLGGSDYCTMYYANNLLNNTVTEQPGRALISGTSMANFTQFGSALKALLVRLRGKAASGGARMKFATGNTTAEGFNKTTYALVQCTPDLTEKQCTDCLNLVIGEFPDCCTDQTGGRVVTPSCTFRYEDWHFFSPLPKNNTNTPPPSPSAAAPPPGKRKNKKQTIIVVVVVSVAASLLLLSTLILIILKRFSSKKNHLKRRRLRKSMKKIQMDDFSMGDDASGESLKFDFRTISNATINFSDANTLGKGGFGVVYRGLLPNGQEIAVKRLSKNSVQGDKEFQTEVMLVAKLQHRNLVRLLGFCLEKEESLLIYEFVANSSLDNFLFDPIKRSDLNWETRFKIIGGVARGILYLHEDSRLRIIHRDLKASNVLLDEEMNPKISDFGTARLFVLDDETRGRTMRIVGTYGYMAPEYAMHGRFSVKSDVFSFGVILLEIVSGQRNNCYQNGEHVEDLSSVRLLRSIQPTNYMYNPDQNVSSVDRFNQALGTLLVRLQGIAASGGSLRKFAAAIMTLPDSTRIFAYVQCTPVLSEKQCNDCLEGAFGEIKTCCNKRAGGRVLKPSCTLRYELSPFIDDTIQIDASSDSPGKGNTKTRTIVVAVVTTVALVTAVIIGISIIFGRRRNAYAMQKLKVDCISNTEDNMTEDSIQYDFGTISQATDNFSDANKLGQGGFGVVYKGKLPNEQEVAVKRLSQGCAQGESEFKNEIRLVIELQHRNLVKLLGFSLQGVERLLVYELVTNSSLDKILFDPIKRAQLGWDTRYKIIAGIARGILYLHEDSRLRIIHRDLKAGNILLDNDMNPKVSDFGTARLFDIDETYGITKKIVGTCGYMSPEYRMHGRFSVKSDVFSFGVLVLEIVRGEKNNLVSGEDTEHLLSYAWKSWRQGRALDLIDPILKASDSKSIKEIMRCIHVGLLCVQERVSARPTMASVVAMLKSTSMALMAPLEPGFYMYSRTNSKMPSPEQNRTYSGGNDPITELVRCSFK